VTEYLELGRLVGKGFGTKAASNPRTPPSGSFCLGSTHNVVRNTTYAHAPCRGRKVSRAG
jgi:hypothetical protein